MGYAMRVAGKSPAVDSQPCLMRCYVWIARRPSAVFVLPVVSDISLLALEAPYSHRWWAVAEGDGPARPRSLAPLPQRLRVASAGCQLDASPAPICGG